VTSSTPAGAGTAADSTALIGFGLDSVIEVSSAAAVAWQFAGRDPERREKTALRIIAISFFALAAYVTVESVRSLLGGAPAEHSTVGLALAAVSLAVMPGLSYAQRRSGRELGSRTPVADSKQTLLCTYLSAVLLIGLGLNSLFGWSWADPLAALIIAAVAIKEGRDAWRGDTCCAPLTAATSDTNDGCTDGCAPHRTGPMAAEWLTSAILIAVPTTGSRHVETVRPWWTRIAAGWPTWPSRPARGNRRRTLDVPLDHRTTRPRRRLARGLVPSARHTPTDRRTTRPLRTTPPPLAACPTDAGA
jgi:hypothetical protein